MLLRLYDTSDPHKSEVELVTSPFSLQRRSEYARSTPDLARAPSIPRIPSKRVHPLCHTYVM